MMPGVARIYVTGHRNPDTDSIASAVGYAELSGRLDPRNEYVPVRLGELNEQTRWVLERSGAPEPELLPHVMLRVCDVMRTRFPLADHREPVRQVGLIMAREEVDLVPVVDDGGRAGRRDDRARARAPVRARVARGVEARRAHRGRRDRRRAGGRAAGRRAGRAGTGRVWVLAMATESLPMGFAAGDVVVVGDRPDAQRIAIEVGVGLLVITNGSAAEPDVLELARARGTAVVASPLDTYVSARMITLSAPCRALMDREPLVVAPRRPGRRHHRDRQGRRLPRGGRGRRATGARSASSPARTSSTPSRGGCCSSTTPSRRRACMGVEHAEIVEILDHHHIGSIETRVPVRATFDPVGSTATLVIERFRQSGMEPSGPAATLLLGAILSDTVILNSPTTTDRDRAVIEYLERVLAWTRPAFGREMFEQHVRPLARAAEDIVARDAKDYNAGGGQTLRIAQVETVGQTLGGAPRRAARRARRRPRARAATRSSR